MARALENQKAVIKERMADLDAIPKLSSANCGKILRSIPTMPPTKAFTITSKVNCFQFWVSPRGDFFCGEAMVQRSPWDLAELFTNGK